MAKINFLWLSSILLGFPGGLEVKESISKCRSLRRCGFDPCVGTIPWRRKWQPSPVFLLGFYGQKSLADYSPWGHKEWDMSEWLSMHIHKYSIIDVNMYLCILYMCVYLSIYLCISIYISHLKPVFCWYQLGLFSCLGYYKWCFYETLGWIYLFRLEFSFFSQMYTQWWDCWIIW